MTSQPFPEAWGYNQIITENGSNMINASITAIKSSGEQQIVATFAFGAFPLMLALVAYNKTRSLAATGLVLLSSTYMVNYFKLITIYVSTPLYILTALILSLAIAVRFWNK